MIIENLKQKMQSKWELFLEHSNIDIETSNNDIFNQLYTHYTESHRKYHNFNHISHCLHEFTEVKNKSIDPISLELAIWFHDIIYNTKSKTNEEDSAKIAKKVAKQLRFTNEQCNKVSNLILATITHTSSENNEIDLLLLIDIDLAILGSNSKIFQQYDENIRNEYSWVPWLLFKRKRKAILKSFLERPQLFQTDYFYQKYEKNARENLIHILKTKY